MDRRAQSDATSLAYQSMYFCTFLDLPGKSRSYQIIGNVSASVNWHSVSAGIDV